MQTLRLLRYAPKHHATVLTGYCYTCFQAVRVLTYTRSVAKDDQRKVVVLVKAGR